MRRRIFQFAILASMMVAPFTIFAQPGFDDDTNDVPLDGGISILTTISLVYGLSKSGLKNKDKVKEIM